jgi:hypothetical protein
MDTEPCPVCGLDYDGIYCDSCGKDDDDSDGCHECDYTGEYE